MMKRIPVHVSGKPGVQYNLWPVAQGIPFAKGELRRGTPVRIVDETGAPLPTQLAPLATWDAEGASIRWLLVDFQADFSAGNRRQFFLEFGDEAIPPAHPQPVKAASWDTGGNNPDSYLRLETGCLRLDFLIQPGQHSNADILSGGEIKTNCGWRNLYHGNPGPYCYLRDQNKIEFRSGLPGLPPRVELEESGPLRACVCIRGVHYSPTGIPLCPYILRLHVFAGKSDLKLFHTFIFDAEPHVVQISSLGLNLPLDMGSGLRAAIGGENNTHWVDRFAKFELIQKDDQTYIVANNGNLFASGRRTHGWAALNGNRGGALAVIRNAWQEYPKGLCITRDGIDIQLWPATAEPLVFTTPFEEKAIYFKGTRAEDVFKHLLAEKPTAPLNLKSLDIQSPKDLLWAEDMIAKHAQGRAMSYNDTGTSNGIGAAKTTEFWLRFRPEAISDTEAESFAAAVQEPLIAPAEPSYACATGAFGHFYHSGDPRFAEIDEGLDLLFNQVVIEPEEKCRLYGMMRYGNLVCSHSATPPVAYVYWKDRHPERALQYVGPYNNEANDQIMALWGNFLHTGRRDHFLRAQAYSRNVADVCICHAHPANPWMIGLMHYHNCHLWSGGGSPSHTLLSGILVDYYTSGNRRLLDVAREVADWAVRYQEPCGIISNRSGVLHRELTGPLWGVFELYRATWEERYGELARRTLNWLLQALPDNGQYPVNIFTGGERGDEAVIGPLQSIDEGARDLYHLYESVWRTCPGKRFRDLLLAGVDDLVWNKPTDNFYTAGLARRFLTPHSKLWPVDDTWYWTQWSCHPGFNLPLVCFAYEITGDLTYAAYAKEQLFGTFRRQVERCRRFADWRFTWVYFGSVIPRLMRIVADALNRDPAGLAAAEQAWLVKRAAAGAPVYRGPGIDFNKDVMDANGNIVNRPPVDLPREFISPAAQGQDKSLGRLKL